MQSGKELALATRPRFFVQKLKKKQRLDKVCRLLRMTQTQTQTRVIADK